ncbi:hypothetical protein I6J42_32785 [Streptomyces californicus]|uniref:Uncharacterized protein n=4 Tax=Streptomyces TaxID=1883 RepID=A0ABD7D6I3_9ACTN|nr:hypothetical protein [Streptomyces californicus]QRV26014.1 hypothetical protein I6J39_00970 [Streptomyces californicus]QRV38323.1 hypothetical protein I6J42_32785 [Streptomyces californicus]QRV39415.1 hypothetical protein I6J41_00800 [Streptomyces californicus]QRV46164.1 hypothetical protein I6J43_00840 [Streptomyces californicus]
MTQAPNDRTNPAGGPGLPEGAGPIDTGTPVRRPAASETAPRTVTGREKAAEPAAPPAAPAPGTGSGPHSPAPHAPGPATDTQPPHAPGSAADGAAPPPHAPEPGTGPMTPDAGAPVPLDHTGATDPRTATGPAAPGSGPGAAHGRAEGGARGGHSLFAPEQREAFAARIQQAVTGFVEDPHQAVRDADATFEEVVADLGAALQERGRKLRAGKGEDATGTGAETEDLRIALQHYRDLTERLVHL